MSKTIPFAEWKHQVFSDAAKQIRADYAAAPWWRKWVYWRALFGLRHY
jgi:hypothetical protein